MELTGVDERADLVVLLGSLGDRDPELAAESDQAISREDFEDAPLGRVLDLCVTR